MNTLWWIYVAMALIPILGVIASRVPVFQSWRMERLSNEVGLGIPDDLDAKIRTPVAGRILWGSIGALLGFVVAGALAIASAAPSGLATFYGIGITMFFGSAVGLTGASFFRQFQKDSRPRMARLTTVSVDSYLPRRARQLAWILLLLTVIAAAIEVWAAPVSERWAFPRPETFILIGLAAAYLASFEVLGRRLVQRGQPAASTDELVWDDALRASAFGTALRAPQIALFACNLFPLVRDDSSALSYWALIPAILFMTGYVFLAWMLWYSRTWYLEVLWPGARRRTPEEEEARTATRP